jgi:hypothetical protein
MNAGFFSRIFWLLRVLLWLTDALLGWYLSTHHIVWLVGAFVAVVPLAVAWKSSPWLECLVEFGSQGSVVVLVISISVALVATNSSILFTLIFMPLVTTFLAKVEMRFADFSQVDTFLFLMLLAVFGLGLGEMIDIMFLPSMR